MPRSNNSWSSNRRVEWLEDTLVTKGYVNRQMLQKHFGIEQSLASMDLRAYRQQGGLIRNASAGETLRDGTVVVGKKSGGIIYYVPADDWRSVTGTTTERQAAWALLPSRSASHRAWLASVMTAWREDNPVASSDDVVAYFGVGVREAKELIGAVSGKGPSVERGRVWGIWA